MRQHTFNLDTLDPDTVPTLPPGAFGPADWRDVPEGYYLLPVHDWDKFGGDCGPDDETPPLDFLGFQVIVRQTPTLVKTGKRAGQTIGKNRFICGQLVLARGVQERVINRRDTDDSPVYQVRYTPSERLKRTVAADRWTAEHDYLGKDGEVDGSLACRCAQCIADRAYDWPYKWKAAPNQADAYANEVAAALIYAIEKEDDACRKLYGQLTGHCGICGRFLYEPESKRIGIGPDCGGRR